MGQLAEFTVNEIAADGQTYSLAADRAIRYRSLTSSRPCLGDLCRRRQDPSAAAAQCQPAAACTCSRGALTRLLERTAARCWASSSVDVSADPCVRPLPQCRPRGTGPKRGTALRLAFRMSRGATALAAARG